jgi:hypothetical protein
MEEDSAEETFGYGDMHRIVLQGIMSAGFLDAKGIKDLFLGACKALNCKLFVFYNKNNYYYYNKLQINIVDPEERTTMPAVQKLVREINERIKPYDMAIRSASCELTGKKFYIFLVTVEKPAMK